MSETGKAKRTVTRCRAHRRIRGACPCYSLAAWESYQGGPFERVYGPLDGSPVAELLDAWDEAISENRKRNAEDREACRTEALEAGRATLRAEAALAEVKDRRG